MQPHGVVSWQAAVVLVVDQKVDVLEVYSSTVASAGNRYEGRAPLVIDTPAVVRLKKQVRMHKDGVKFSRSNILTRDQCKCCYCGRKFPPKMLNYDHVVPRVQGGKTTFENVVSSCFSCNLQKGGRTPAQAKMKMHYQPYRPTALSGARPMLLDLSRAPKEWMPYVDPTYGTQTG